MKKNQLKIGQVISYIHRVTGKENKAAVTGLKHEASNKVRVIDLSPDWSPTPENIAEWNEAESMPKGSFVFVPGCPIELKSVVAA